MVEHTKIRVKPLEWGTTLDGWAGTPFGRYSVSEAWTWRLMSYPYGIEDDVLYPTAELAKAAAQADYERRILSAIEPDPDACNAFDDLVAALKRVDASWTEAFPDGPDGSREYLGGIGVLSDDTANLWRDIRAALSRAGAA